VTSTSNTKTCPPGGHGAATLEVVLPSASGFEGGQITVSHGAATETIDISNSATASTSLLAWYTDVASKAAPVTAGYRLALCYDITYPTTSHPIAFPDVSANVQQLRRVLSNWAKGEYVKDTPTYRFFAYALKHQYPENALSSGFKALRGCDMYKVAQLLHVAREMGVVAGLANLEYCQQGDGNKSYTLSSIVNKDGGPLVQGGERTHLLDSRAVIPQDALAGVPDGEGTQASTTERKCELVSFGIPVIIDSHFHFVRENGADPLSPTGGIGRQVWTPWRDLIWYSQIIPYLENNIGFRPENNFIDPALYEPVARSIDHSQTRSGTPGSRDQRQ